MFTSAQCENDMDEIMFQTSSSSSMLSIPELMKKKNTMRFKHSNIITNLSAIDPITNELYSAGLDSTVVKWIPPRHHTRELDHQTQQNLPSLPSNTLFQNTADIVSQPSSTTDDNLMSSCDLSPPLLDMNNNSSNNGTSNDDSEVYMSLDKLRLAKYNVCTFVDGNSMIITCEDNYMTLWSLTTSSDDIERMEVQKLKSVVLSDMDRITCATKLGKLIFLGSASGKCKIVEVVKDVTSNSIGFRNHTLVSTPSNAPIVESAASTLWKLFNHRSHHHRGRIYAISVIGSSIKKYLLATAGADGYVKLWNVNDNRFSNPDYDPSADQTTDNAYTPLYVVRLATLIQVVHPYIDTAPVYQLENCTLDDGSFWHVRFWANDGHRRIVAWSCKIPQDNSETVDGGVEVSELRLFENLGQFSICKVENTDIRDGNGNFDLLLLGWNARFAKFDVFHLTPKPMEEKLMNKLCFSKHYVQSIKLSGVVFVKDCGVRAAKVLSKEPNNINNNSYETTGGAGIIEANIYWPYQSIVEGRRLHYARPMKRGRGGNKRVDSLPGL